MIKIDAVLRIRIHLAKNRITQKWVCEKTGIGYDGLCRILKEKATMRLEEYELICWALEVEVGEFLCPRKPNWNKYDSLRG